MIGQNIRSTPIMIYSVKPAPPCRLKIAVYWLSVVNLGCNVETLCSRLAEHCKADTFYHGVLLSDKCLNGISFLWNLIRMYRHWLHQRLSFQIIMVSLTYWTIWNHMASLLQIHTFDERSSALFVQASLC